jgi:hypothetical protein
MSPVSRRSAWAGSVAGSVVTAVLAASPALAVTVPIGDNTQLVRVTQDAADPANGWVAQSYDASANDQHWTNPDQSYVVGPTSNPAIGAGSHVLRVGQYAGQVEMYRTAMFDGTSASDISHLSYATYAAATDASGDTKQPAYLRLSFDTNGDSTPDSWLYYEPSIDHSDGVADGVWQNWDTTDEQWSTTGGPESLTTLQQFAIDNPTAVISGTNDGADGGVALIADGTSGQFNGVYGVDRFAITTADHSDLFDFDPSVDSNTSNVTVTSDQGGWNAGAFDFGAGTAADVAQSMAFGPETPPAGIGSHMMREGDNEDVVQFWRTTELDGVNVGDIRTLDYSTYVKPDAGNTNATTQQPPYLRLSISSDGSGVKDTTLNFEPANNSDQGAVHQNAWQRWHTASGYYRVVEGPGETADNLVTLAAYAARHPNATIVPRTVEGQGTGGAAFLVGAGGDNQVDSNFYVDNVESDYFHGAAADSDKTFDFEPTVPAPSISVPSVVLGRTSIDITGNTNVPNAPVALFEKKFGAADFTQVDSQTAGDDGSYAFQRTVTKQTEYFVRSYDRTNSDVATVKVRIDPNLTLSTSTGKLHMAVHTSPRVVGQTVKFYKRNANGHRTLLATRTTNKHGNAYATISAPSGHTITVFANVTAPAGNLPVHSPDQAIRIA